MAKKGAAAEKSSTHLTSDSMVSLGGNQVKFSVVAKPKYERGAKDANGNRLSNDDPANPSYMPPMMLQLSIGHNQNTVEWGESHGERVSGDVHIGDIRRL